MYKIRYYYSSLSKQIFILIFTLYMIGRILLFHIAGFGEFYYPLASTLMYILIIAISLFLLGAYRYYEVSFDEENIIIDNKLLRKKKELKIAQIQKADFTRIGIKLYTNNMNKATHMIPIYFFGKMSPVGCENFEIMLKNMKVPEVNKHYKVLPGFGPISRTIGFLYVFSSAAFLVSTIQIFELIYFVIRDK